MRSVFTVHVPECSVRQIDGSYKRKNEMITTAPHVTQTHQVETTLFFVLLQLVVIILTARAAGNLARGVGQTRAVGEIVAGLLLGPSLLGRIYPDAFEYVFHSVSSTPISVISQVGLTLLMFQIGMDFEFAHLTEKRNRRAVSLISAATIILPFVFGMMLGQISAPYLAPGINPLPYSLFLGAALSITAVPILGRILMELDLTRTPLGAVVISSAAINDVMGWLALAVISALSLSQFSLAGTLIQVGWLLLYMACCWLAVRPLLKWVIARFDLSKDRLPPDLMAILLALVFVSGMCTFKIGIFSIFGGFMLGVLVHDNHRLAYLWKRGVGDFVLVFFLPIFFTYTGLRTNIAGLDTVPLWNWCAAIVFFAVLGKFGGGYLGARLSGLDRQEAGTVGILMNTRALMELIVVNIGYDLGFIPQNVFTMLVIMAIFTTVITAPMVRAALPKMGYAVPRGIDA
jgi:Kef-type K+ transport system membrane component KefB